MYGSPIRQPNCPAPDFFGYSPQFFLGLYLSHTIRPNRSDKWRATGVDMVKIKVAGGQRFSLRSATRPRKMYSDGDEEWLPEERRRTSSVHAHSKSSRVATEDRRYGVGS